MATAFAESGKAPTQDAVAISGASAERFSETAPTGKSHASPRARRLARESGVPLDQLQGSGPGGRIVERDITAFVAQAVAVTSGATAQPATLKRSGQFRDLPLSAVRRSIARRMMESAQGAPVFFTTVKVLTDPLTEFRSQLARARSVQVSVNDVLVRACALALREHPGINASFTGEAIRIFEDIDISIAVAIDDGLITPVLRNADQKGLIAAATEIRALADKAQRGQLLVNEYQGGTFTVSNLGMFGVESFTAILNPPQAAILAVGGISREVWLDAGVPRERGVMRLTLTSDHRVIDGARITIERCRPLITVEFWPFGIRNAGDDPVAVIEQYLALGYASMVIVPTGEDVTGLPAPAVIERAMAEVDATTLALLP